MIDFRRAGQGRGALGSLCLLLASVGCYRTPAPATHSAAKPTNTARSVARLPPAPRVVEYVQDGNSHLEPQLMTTFVESGSPHTSGLLSVNVPGNPFGQYQISEEREGTIFERPWLGVSMARQPADEPGVLVSGIVRDSPAAKAGLQAKDVLLLIDGDPVNAPSDVSYLVQGKRVGNDAAVGALRDGRFMRFTVRLKPFPEPSEQFRIRYVGKPAPDWGDTGLSLGTQSVTLGKYRGKPLVLVFWRPDCSDCPAALAYGNRWYSQYGSKSLTVLGITTLEPNDSSREAAKRGIKHPNVCDHRGSVTRAYNALPPAVFLIDREGVVRDVIVGAKHADFERMEKTLKSLL